MTRERAIEMFTNMKNNYDAYGKLTGQDEITQMLDMAIQALQEQKPKYPCELCKWHLQEDDTACWGCNAKPIEEEAEE